MEGVKQGYARRRESGDEREGGRDGREGDIGKPSHALPFVCGLHGIEALPLLQPVPGPLVLQYGVPGCALACTQGGVLRAADSPGGVLGGRRPR